MNLTPKEIFAARAGYKTEQIINFRVLEDGSAVGIIPTGQKFTYTAQEMQFTAARMHPELAEGLETKKPAPPARSGTKKQTSKPKKDTSKTK